MSNIGKFKNNHEQNCFHIFVISPGISNFSNFSPFGCWACQWNKQLVSQRPELKHRFIYFFHIFLIWLILQYVIIKQMIHLPCPWNLRSGSTIAKNRSLDKAVNVNTDTPIDTSFTNSDIVHIILPHGHDSNV